MIETDNLYYAAYLFNEGMNFCGAKPHAPGSQKIIFSFDSPDPLYARELASLYQAHESTTNVRKYLDSLVLMRDILHKTAEKQRSHKERREGLSGKKNEQPFKTSAG